MSSSVESVIVVSFDVVGGMVTVVVEDAVVVISIVRFDLRPTNVLEQESMKSTEIAQLLRFAIQSKINQNFYL